MKTHLALALLAAMVTALPSVFLRTLSDSGNCPDQRRRPEIIGNQAEHHGREAAQGRPRSQYATRVDAIGECRKQRHREHVPERIGARHQSGLRCAQAPQRHQGCAMTAGTTTCGSRLPTWPKHIASTRACPLSAAMNISFQFSLN